MIGYNMVIKYTALSVPTAQFHAQFYTRPALQWNRMARQPHGLRNPCAIPVPPRPIRPSAILARSVGFRAALVLRNTSSTQCDLKEVQSEDI